MLKNTAMNNKFVVFIVTHGRPDRVITIKTLRKQGYTGEIYLIVDDEDTSIPEYKKLYGDRVLIFCKQRYIELTDDGDNFDEKRAVVYARNACFEMAESIGKKLFIVLDDDYTEFRYKTDSEFNYKDKQIKDLDKTFSNLFNYYLSIPAKSIAISQNGDYIGGAGNNLHTSLGRRRKCMNSFFCSTDRPYQFLGKINEDLTVTTRYQGLGNLFLTYPLLSLKQIETQQNTGGLTDIYLALGTYVKSFYSVMFQPSSIKISMMGDSHRRLHHAVDWERTVPCIISEQYRKASRVTGETL